jgi:ribonuclease E
LKLDKARTQVGRISKFGLMEMSRQRLRPSIVFGGYTTCPHCGGRGLTPTVETLAVAFLRQLSLKTLKEDIGAVRCQVPVPVAHYLLNRKRRELLDLEQRRDISISIEGVAQMVPGQSDIQIEPRPAAA